MKIISMDLGRQQGRKKFAKLLKAERERARKRERKTESKKRDQRDFFGEACFTEREAAAGG